MEHPRWGMIQTVTPLRDLKAGEELFTYYGYGWPEGGPDFPEDFHIKVPTTSLYLKICTHSFEILTKTLQGQWSLFKTGCANQL